MTSWRYHVPRGTAYRHGTTPEAIADAARRGFLGIDLDTRLTKDAIPVVCHWADISIERFSATGIPTHARIEDLTWAQVSRLRAPDGSRIRALSEVLTDCAAAGIVACIEAKRSDPRWMWASVWERIKEMAGDRGATVQATAVRRLWGPVKAARVQRAAKAAGIPNWHKPSKRPTPRPPKEQTMGRLPADTPDRLRKAGLKVVTHAGWRERGRPGAFNPVGVLCHHTATGRHTSDAAVINLLTKGRSDLPGPLAQFGLARDGTVHLIAAGRANHAGKAKASGTVAAGDGNALYIGIEAFNDGVGEKWPKAQYDAYVKLAAALCRDFTGNSAATVRGHKETSVTGKIDPTFDMHRFREAVGVLLVKQPAKEKPVVKQPPRIEQAYTLLWHIINDARKQGKTGYARRVHAIARMFNVLGVRPKKEK